MRRTTILIQVRLSNVIKGRHAPSANHKPFAKSRHVYCGFLGNADSIAEFDLTCIFMQCFVITLLK